jgi:hypothetical protein
VATLILSGAVVLAILETNHAFVRAWIGEAYYGGTVLTAVILANMMARHWVSTYTVGIFYYSGRVRESTLMQFADGVLSVGFSIFLVRRMGVVGAPLGSLVAVLIAEVPAGLFLMAHDSGVSVWKLVSPIVPWLVSFVPLAALAAATGVWLGSSSLIVVAGAGAVIGTVYVAAMLALLRRPPLDVYAAPWLAKKAPFLESLFRRKAS